MPRWACALCYIYYTNSVPNMYIPRHLLLYCLTHRLLEYHWRLSTYRVSVLWTEAQLLGTILACLHRYSSQLDASCRSPLINWMLQIMMGNSTTLSAPEVPGILQNAITFMLQPKFMHYSAECSSAACQKGKWPKHLLAPYRLV